MLANQVSSEVVSKPQPNIIKQKQPKKIDLKKDTGRGMETPETKRSFNRTAANNQILSSSKAGSDAPQPKGRGTPIFKSGVKASPAIKNFNMH